ncbi:MAG: S8 family serine peptidase [Planctomycetota bacterium]
MADKSLSNSLRIVCETMVILFVVWGLSLQPSYLECAEPVVVSNDSVADSMLDSTGHGRGVSHPRMATRHILIQLRSDTDHTQFLEKAKGQGLHQRGRVYGSNWLTMSIPSGAEPRKAAAAAKRLPGVLNATPDPIVRINDQIPPCDPIYADDDDPSTKDCDPLIEECDPWELVDQWGLFKVEAQSAWNVQLGSPEVVIAILDSGMDLDHDDLWDKIWTNPGESANGNDDDSNGFVDDIHGADFCGDNRGHDNDNVDSQDPDPDIPQGGTWEYDSTPLPWGYGIRFDGDPAVGDALDNNFDGFFDPGVSHGTFVAGVAGAMTNNLSATNPPDCEGMAGAAWHCKMMPVRLINAEGWAYGSDAASAVYYATNMGADVINVSWGMDLNSADSSVMEEIQILVQAIDYAVSQGVIVVAAAGNTATAGLHFPACMSNTIAVGASNWIDERSDFSNFAALGEIPDNGIDDDGNGWVDDVIDVLAPGELIWSTAVLSGYDGLLYMLLGMDWVPGDETYGQADGTSFSTPLLSGYVGLILSQNPGATLSDVREVIRSNAADILDPNGDGSSLQGYDAYSGFGRMRMIVPAKQCGDGNCDSTEDQCNCDVDCGTPSSTETNCTDAVTI